MPNTFFNNICYTDVRFPAIELGQAKISILFQTNVNTLVAQLNFRKFKCATVNKLTSSGIIFESMHRQLLPEGIIIYSSASDPKNKILLTPLPGNAYQVKIYIEKLASSIPFAEILQFNNNNFLSRYNNL